MCLCFISVCMFACVCVREYACVCVIEKERVSIYVSRFCVRVYVCMGVCA